ncbi:MAG: hypothetical protein TR69_WS6001001244 [candidate division WS6 bacterium OLB20]|uniref:Uncharacterized protein n=1 Tax=candidate division WS6 bacterium OLB20 TaxID=1617426 RepID=A0A136LX74_9BACT|nr:MAG: hypothetical protein TR69_WS6001001244 [candidate division WS6 bacterium OLB20]
MKRFTSSINIDAPVEHVWDTMLSDATYRDWTSVFHPGSHFEGTWEKGSEMRFIGPDEDGLPSGVVSRVVENRPYEYVGLEHVGSFTSDRSMTPAAEGAGKAPGRTTFSKNG